MKNVLLSTLISVFIASGAWAQAGSGTAGSGGASGGTGKAGSADPIETHVYLETSESDATAQEMLDISERTCFLHAFCKTDLKTKLKIKRIA